MPSRYMMAKSEVAAMMKPAALPRLAEKKARVMWKWLRLYKRSALRICSTTVAARKPTRLMRVCHAAGSVRAWRMQWCMHGKWKAPLTCCEQ